MKNCSEIDLRDTEVLIAGPMVPQVTDPLSNLFSTHQLARAEDRALYLKEHGQRIRGLACASSHGFISADWFDHLPALEIVSSMGVGYEKIDVDEAVRRGIVVTHTPFVLDDDVADIAIALLISSVRALNLAERHLRMGKWTSSRLPLTSTLRNRRVGIVGLGRIGKKIAVRCVALGLEVSYHGRHRQDEVPYRFFDSILDLASAVDTLIVAAPGGKDTRHLIDREVLRKLGRNGVLVNISRGSLVDEDALVSALKEREILAAGLDVYQNEPNVRKDLLDLENAVLLPHVGSATEHSRSAMSRLLVDNLRSWFLGMGAVTPVPEARRFAHPSSVPGSRPGHIAF